jgi:hypothetical protein
MSSANQDAVAIRAKIARVFAVKGRNPETYCSADHISCDSRTESARISLTALPKARRLIPGLINAGSERGPKYGFGIKDRPLVNPRSLSKC